MTTHYVLGFVFSGNWVLRYVKPEGSMHAGMWNGVGGHVEPGEDPIDAMKREFHEETGIPSDAAITWQECATLLIGTDDVTVFAANVRGRPEPTVPDALWWLTLTAAIDGVDPPPAPHARWLMMLAAEHVRLGIEATYVVIGDALEGA